MTEKTFKHWRLERDDHDIAWAYIDKAEASANTLGREVLEEFYELLKQVQQERPQGLVILSGKANGFIAGADINEFTT